MNHTRTGNSWMLTAGVVCRPLIYCRPAPNSPLGPWSLMKGWALTPLLGETTTLGFVGRGR